MDIHFDSDRKFEIKPGIIFNNWKLNDFSINYLLGEHKDYINARKMIHNTRKNWTQEDYNKLLCSVKEKPKKRKIFKNQISIF